MTDTNKLAELIKQAKSKMFIKTFTCELERNMFVADYLLANGVILPPCKVGDKTFLLLEKVCGGYDIVESYCARILDNGNGKIYSMFYDFGQIEMGNSLEFRICDFGKTVFLTKEETEEKLRELKPFDR